MSVEIGASPENERFFEVEDDKGGGDVGKGQLSEDYAGDVVEAFVRAGSGAVGGEEEGTDVTAEIYKLFVSADKY